MRKNTILFLILLVCGIFSGTFAETCPQRTVIVEHHSLYSEPLLGDLVFDVYVPYCSDAEQSETYPVLYLLHGQDMGITIWEEMRLRDILLDSIRQGNIPPFLIVAPQEDQYLLSLSLSGFGDSILDYLIPWVDEHYNTCTDRLCRGIAGLSRGALWAERISFQHADLFSSLGLLSLPGKIFDDQSVYYLAGEHKPDNLLRIRMDIGSDDSYRHEAIKAAEQLVFIGYPFEFNLVRGEHDPEYWRSELSKYLLWFGEGWRQLNLP